MVVHLRKAWRHVLFVFGDALGCLLPAQRNFDLSGRLNNSPQHHTLTLATHPQPTCRPTSLPKCLAVQRGLSLSVCRLLLVHVAPADAPAENNPEVMTSLVHNLGLSNKLAFHDVFSIDDPDLLAFVPRPAYALLLIFPVSETYENFRVQEDKERPQYDGHGPEENVLWYKQTIGNACGLIGLLHGVSNGTARSYVGQ
jgi:hypothetical protein